MHICISQYYVFFPFPKILLSHRRCINSNLCISRYLVTHYQNKRVWVIWKKNEPQHKTKKGLCFYMRERVPLLESSPSASTAEPRVCLFPQFRVSASPTGHALHRGDGSENWPGPACPHEFRVAQAHKFQFMLMDSSLPLFFFTLHLPLCSELPACVFKLQRETQRKHGNSLRDPHYID